MRKEAKLAVAIVVGVFVIILLWWGLARKSKKSTTAPANETATVNKTTDETNIVEVETTEPSPTPTTPYSEKSEAPLVQPVYQPTTQPSGEAVIVPAEPSAAEVPGDKETHPSTPTEPTLAETPSIIVSAQPTATVEPTPSPTETSTEETNKPKEGTTAIDPITGRRYYIVKKGDTGGFWGISKSIYGTGRYMKAIQQANPDLDPRKLRPGQKIWLPSEEILSLYKPRRTIPRPSSKTAGKTTRKITAVRTGAPVSTVMPDGRVFD